MKITDHAVDRFRQRFKMSGTADEIRGHIVARVQEALIRGRHEVRNSGQVHLHHRGCRYVLAPTQDDDRWTVVTMHADGRGGSLRRAREAVNK